MRVFKSAKWVSGLAASGGLMLMLGGNALAADGDSGMVAVSDQSATVQVSESQTTTSTMSLATTTQPSQSVQAPVATNIATSAVASGDAPKVAESAPSEDSLTPVAAASSALINPSDPAPAMAAQTPAVEPNEATKPTIVSLGLYDLPIQPIITSIRPEPVIDLPSQLPTATNPVSPTQAPTPARPTGALGALSIQLAGSVVKSVFLPAAVGLGAAAPLSLMIFLPLLTLRVLSFAFGFLTRRHGSSSRRMRRAAPSEIPSHPSCRETRARRSRGGSS